MKEANSASTTKSQWSRVGPATTRVDWFSATGSMDSATRVRAVSDNMLSTAKWESEVDDGTFLWSTRNTTTAARNATHPLHDMEDFLRQKNDEFTMLVIPAIVFLGILFVIG